jgi:predicted transcriptional regulator
MSTILEMAAEILAAHASSTPMTSDELISELQKIHSTLQSLESGTEIIQHEQEKPALTGKQSIKKNEVICLLCNKGGFKTLTRHLTTAHQIKPKDYKKQFGISAKQSLSAKSLTESRKQNAIDKGLGDNLAKAREVKAANFAARMSKPAKKATVPASKNKSATPDAKVKAPVKARAKKISSGNS